jgi:diguanylate cyclase (GGDEF)-like protein
MARFEPSTHRPTAPLPRPAASASGWPDSATPLLMDKTQDPDFLLQTLAKLAEAERLLAAQRKRIQQLENLSLTDELTGLANRRAFQQALTRELSGLQRDARKTGVLILFDMDQFKAVNDQYGHPAGDAYLRMVGAVLRAHTRPHDSVARLGGDEFAVLLTETTPADGLQRAAKLAEALNLAAIGWKGQTIPLQASYGAIVIEATDSESDLMAGCDARLYAQKETRATWKKAQLAKAQLAQKERAQLKATPVPVPFEKAM